MPHFASHVYDDRPSLPRDDHEQSPVQTSTEVLQRRRGRWLRRNSRQPNSECRQTEATRDPCWHCQPTVPHRTDQSGHNAYFTYLYRARQLTSAKLARNKFPSRLIVPMDKDAIFDSLPSSTDFPALITRLRKHSTKSHHRLIPSNRSVQP